MLLVGKYFIHSIQLGDFIVVVLEFRYDLMDRTVNISIIMIELETVNCTEFIPY
jgi:hypothetical protein